MKNRGVVSVIGRDQKGVVARISTYLAACDINIEDIEQRVVEGLFIMTHAGRPHRRLDDARRVILGLKAIGDEIGVEIDAAAHRRAASASASRSSSPRSRTASSS